MKKFPMRYKYYTDNDGYRCAEQLYWDVHGFRNSFFVRNLNECPKDAIIEGDLFSAEDFIEAVKFGMRLAQAGYDDIEVIEKTEVSHFDEQRKI